MPWTTLALAGAGALGVLARHAVQRLVPRPGAVPWGTFVVNVSGALVAGLLLSLIARRSSAPQWVQETLFVGFLGGYTTFSALSAETLLLLETRQYAVAAAYSIGSLAAGLAAIHAGTALGRWMA
jgi:fluoride exporter